MPEKKSVLEEITGLSEEEAACWGDSQIRPKPRKPKRMKPFPYKKWGGNDKYSWAVFRRGCLNPIVTGLSKREAMNFSEQFEREKRF